MADLALGYGPMVDFTPLPMMAPQQAYVQQAFPGTMPPSNSWYPSPMQQNPFEESQVGNQQTTGRSAAEKKIYLAMLMIPYLIFEPSVASYTVFTEVFSELLTQLGVPEKANLIATLFIQTVDLKAFRRGRFKIVEGASTNYYQELYDASIGKLGANDFIRLGSQYFMPQSAAPEYEEKR